MEESRRNGMEEWDGLVLRVLVNTTVNLPVSLNEGNFWILKNVPWTYTTNTIYD
jgi:hypothetical protein